jgi:hypothetical protein
LRVQRITDKMYCLQFIFFNCHGIQSFSTEIQWKSTALCFGLLGPRCCSSRSLCFKPEQTTSTPASLFRLFREHRRRRMLCRSRIAAAAAAAHHSLIAVTVCRVMSNALGLGSWGEGGCASLPECGAVSRFDSLCRRPLAVPRMEHGRPPSLFSASCACCISSSSKRLVRVSAFFPPAAACPPTPSGRMPAGMHPTGPCPLGLKLCTPAAA